MAEKLLKTSLESLQIREEDLLAMKANQVEKQALAWLLKSNTTVTGVWLADRLKLGHSSNVSRSLRVDREFKKLKQKMTKCKA
ncbi:hypothetical protein P0Y35_12625 [Kiritimatiellaeota bacterium B1221]|nr:hypothetical protein [Kiritimatiellaeota bacterium B1221]